MIQASSREYLPWSQDTCPRFTSALRLSLQEEVKSAVYQTNHWRSQTHRGNSLDLSTLHLIVCDYTIIIIMLCFARLKYHEMSLPVCGFLHRSVSSSVQANIIVEFLYEKPLMTQVMNDIFSRHANFFQKHIIYDKPLREKIKFIMYNS